ncbi:phosphate ABC transporter permease subunit PstC [Catenuloplanes indicus]|uniref:Phosphate transport system permease protein n=1 Tax=Catenuloplanes indicus TaxID=137267 RepID=A0AAE3W266_9ACTN|nr:phosphate ABC transporter permease subunit PstC [Catenuloplanes indicus]MDQ0368166.1 phosphate transport system permease protein [Catenuloplanes indicus]
MGDTPPRSVDASAGGPGGNTRAAGLAASADGLSDNNSSNGRRTPLGGNGGGTALPRAKAFGTEPAFRGLTLAAGTTVLVIIVAIAVFLITEAIPALQANEENFFTYNNWAATGTPPRFGIAAIVFGTVVSAVIALIIAVPIALGIALFLSHYAHRRIATGLGFVIDLLAAVPSVVFGLWGRSVFIEPVRDFSVWLHTYFGWIPLFGGEGPYGNSILLGSLVLAIMILPIVTSLSREVFMQTPKQNEEAALALGATKWEMIRTAVLPYGRPGVIAAVMLGLGRALGETIALAMTLGSSFVITADIITNGGVTIASNIANGFGEANEIGRGALIASGLVLFAITLVVNMAARIIIYRRREFTDVAA